MLYNLCPYKSYWRASIVLAFLVSATGVDAQSAQFSTRMESYSVDTGYHSYLTERLLAEPKRVFEQRIEVEEAAWIRIYFDDYQLGNGSYITITSLKDGGEQRFDARSLAEWRGASGFLRGGAARIELYVAPHDENVFFRISKLLVGEGGTEVDGEMEGIEQVGVDSLKENDEGSSQHIVIDSDDRVASNDHAVGRIMPVGCTGWLAANGAFLAAGHCLYDRFGNLRLDRFSIIEFRVPESTSNGWPIPANDVDQYPILGESVSDFPHRHEGLGNDWVVFEVGRNMITGRVPVETYGRFYRVTRFVGERSGNKLRVTGFGDDCIDPEGLDHCPSSERNSDAFTQQTHADNEKGEVDCGSDCDYWKFRTDTMGGNSGSPVINFDVERYSSPIAVAILTHSCLRPFPPADRNCGTSFENLALNFELGTFPGPNIPGHNVSYVDHAHPNVSYLGWGDGSLYLPFQTISEGIQDVAAGGVVSIVAGTYGETLTINKAMRIEAPVGTVVIDPTSPSTSLVADAAKSDSLEALSVGNEVQVPTEFNLGQNYPNPVVATAQIDVALPEASHVSLVLYDVLGREVARLVEGEMQAGLHTIPFDASSLSSGVYVYRVVAGDFVQSRRMLMVR